jgi:hypothetical protein
MLARLARDVRPLEIALEAALARLGVHGASSPTGTTVPRAPGEPV